MSKARAWADQTRRWRWPLAFVAAVLAVVFAVLSHYGSIGEVCGDAVAAANKVRVCGPPSLGDLVLLFVPSLLLLLPDMSELSVMGVSLKRVEDKVDQAESKVDQAESDALQRLTQLLTTSEELTKRLLLLEHTAKADAESLRASVDSYARTFLESTVQLGARVDQLERHGEAEQAKQPAGRRSRSSSDKRSGKAAAAKRPPKGA